MNVHNTTKISCRPGEAFGKGAPANYAYVKGRWDIESTNNPQMQSNNLLVRQYASCLGNIPSTFATKLWCKQC